MGKEKKKSFDAVQFMREARARIAKDLGAMSGDDQKRVLRTRVDMPRTGSDNRDQKPARTASG